MGHSPIRKFYHYTREAEQKGRKIYYLNIGQPDIKTPKTFFDAIRQFDQEVLAYTPSQGIPSLIDAIQAYYQNLGISYDTRDIMVTQGGSEALTFVLMCITNEGDEVIVPEPFYSNYSIFVKGTGASIVPLTTKVEDGFHFAKRSDIEKLITPRTKAILLSNPGNPTGTVLTAEEMRMIADVAKERDLVIISDEVYREFVYDGIPVTSFGQLPDVADRVVLIDSISKRFSACGARIGAVITRNQDLQSHLMKLCQGRLSCATLDQVGAAALYRIQPSYFNQVKEEYQRRRDLVYQKLCEIEGVICRKPYGAFYITAKLPVENAEDFLIYLLTQFEEGGETVMFAPVEGFYETKGLGRNEIRIAYVLNERDLTRAMDLLKKGLTAYQNLQSSRR